jgi:peroxiredoxin (alkyl hydroperoxide reductase subunit C)
MCLFTVLAPAQNQPPAAGPAMPMPAAADAANPQMQPMMGCPMMRMMMQGMGAQPGGPMMCPMTGMMGRAQPPPAHLPLIGEDAPSFKAETTQGPISFPEDYKGKWVILFSHPADFTPVCTTEFMTFQSMLFEFRALNCALIGLSIDSNYSHIAWLLTIEQKIKYKGMEKVAVTFPVISDVKMEIAKKYGMIQPSADDTKAVRAVFFIDPKAKIRALIYYPLSNGRNIQEIKRLLIAMQTSDKHQCATPANWQPGDDVIIPPPGSCGTANLRVAGAGKDYYCLDWFLCLKKLPKEELNLPPEVK